MIPKCEAAITTRNKDFPTYNCRKDCFKYSFFPSTLKEWFQLDINIRNSDSISLNSIDPIGLKLLNRLRLDLSHRNEHKFRHNFQDFLNPWCSCSLEIEDTTHYLLHCQHFSNQRCDLMSSVKSIIPNFKSLTDNNRIDILLYGDSRFDENANKIILKATINYLNNSERLFHYVVISLF